jgi:hypothetical protein
MSKVLCPSRSTEGCIGVECAFLMETREFPLKWGLMLNPDR